MTALAGPRTQAFTQEAEASAIPRYRSYPVAASAQIWEGGMVALNAAGYAKAAATGDTKVVGVAEFSVKGGLAAGDQRVTVRRGAYTFANKGGDLVTQADIASPALCYVEDDQTVRHTAAGSIAAGRPVEVTSNGVTVEFF